MSETEGVVRPEGDRWLATCGLGSHTRQLGVYATREEAVTVAGEGGRRVVFANKGESGWDAYVRVQREDVAATVGLPVDWMSSGDVLAVELDELTGHPHWGGDPEHARKTLEAKGLYVWQHRTERKTSGYRLAPHGDTVRAALVAGHMSRRVLLCDSRPWPSEEPGHPRGAACVRCGGRAYYGDRETE
ncbi:hypothetical protein EV193_104408 [Herbihabitans rhizosphaerae]|uniref:Uncharacterized protein n=1 Tax=Herbihabitans rhizosphaerae TaxID=1872711 RepID=A0A4Q7KUM5_9PSEU|nr:hypothetical protein [Herbihabitans rhizosphaerae]RZS39192.1 hypothetical protein EV193_104408 [Herbihabitans rhizosphaerae]